MVEETYLKQTGDSAGIVSFEGPLEEIYRIHNFVKEMNVPVECVEYDMAKDEDKHDMVNRPVHYCTGKIETIEKIEAVVEGLPSKEAYLLGNIIKYVDRVGLKDDVKQELQKANNYSHRLVYGTWRNKK